MQIENLINKSTDTKNTDTKTINDMTAGMRVSDYIKTDSSDNMSKKATQLLFFQRLKRNTWTLNWLDVRKIKCVRKKEVLVHTWGKFKL